MMKHLGVAFALLVVAICPDVVSAQAGEGEAWSLPGFGETDFSLTSTTLTQYRLDNFDDKLRLILFSSSGSGSKHHHIDSSIFCIG